VENKKPQFVAKENQVQALYELFSANQAVFFVDYRGISVAEDTVMRAELRKAEATYLVAKNTLMKLAYNKISEGLLDAYLEGPTSIACTNNPAETAKILSKAIKANKKMQFKVAILDGKVLSVEEIEALAKLPSKEVLLAQVCGTFQAPIASFVRVLDKVREQKEAAEAGA